MGLIDTLETFAMNLPGAVDDLRELKREFCETGNELAREGAELFTLGFDEMVLKKNGAWQTSEEYQAAARRAVKEARQQYPDLAGQFSRVTTLFEEQWQALEDAREECWEALQELDTILVFANGAELDEKVPYSWMGWPDQSRDANNLANLSETMPSPDPTAEEILTRIEKAAYRKVLQEQGFTNFPKNVDLQKSPSWLQQVWDHHKLSKEEFQASAAHVNDSDAIDAITSWECMRIEPLTDLAHRAGRLFRAAAGHCMAKATEIEHWLESDSPKKDQIKDFLERTQAAISSSKFLAVLVHCPITTESEGIPVIDPIFSEGLHTAENFYS